MLAPFADDIEVGIRITQNLDHHWIQKLEFNPSPDGEGRIAIVGIQSALTEWGTGATKLTTRE